MSAVRPTVSHMTREARMVLRGSTLTHEFLRARLTGPRGWVEEAERARLA